jgi:hypothetical protein
LERRSGRPVTIENAGDDGCVNISAPVADSSRSSEIQYRELRVTDDVVAITHLLHEAYAPLAAAGMRYVASHQSPEITRNEWAKATRSSRSTESA